jgi:hypothetical protein
MNANRTYRCTRCKTEIRTAWTTPARECTTAGCTGVMRYVSLRVEQANAKAKRELAIFETRAQA